MKDFTKEVFEERKRIWDKYGRQKKTALEWRNVFAKQLADMTIAADPRYFERVKELYPEMDVKALFRREVIQLAAACEESLENSEAW